MKRVKSCANCAKGIDMRINKDILCKINGVVSRDYLCFRFVRKAGRWSPSERAAKCIECEFFLVSEDEMESFSPIGYCQLFTVRTYNGEQKSACSKFSKKVVPLIPIIS